MTTSGKYMSKTNLYNRHESDYTNSSNNYSSPRRPQRSAATPVSANNYTHNRNRNRGREETPDGEDEKKLLSLSDRIKRLSTSRVLKDSSGLTHNNNEPFTYLRGPPPEKPKRASIVNVNKSGVNSNTNIPKKSREVIYAQVVVDPETRKYSNGIGNRGVPIVKNKRTVHRSYNNNSYPNNTHSSESKSKYGTNNNTNNNSSVPKMRGRNVTTVLLNSSSDDIPSSLNMEERVGFNNNDFRYRSSSSPLLASNNEDYYPKSPGIVKHLHNGYNPSSRSRYENHYQTRHSTDYLQRHQSDEDDYNDYKFKKGDKYSNLRERSPFGYGGRDASDNSDDLYNYQPINYGGKSASTNFIDSYNQKSRSNYRIEEEDEYDVTKNSKFEERRSKTLDRDSSFRKNNYGSRAEDFINRSKTLDNRISSLKERSMMLEDQKRREGNDFYKSKLDADYLKRNNAQIKSTSSSNLNNNTKGKEKSSGSTNIFSTLLRRNNKKSEQKNLPQSKSTSALHNNVTNFSNRRSVTPSSTKAADGNKKTGQNSSNFFASFLEKKRKKQQLNADLKSSKSKGQALKEDNTYQSYNWPHQEPPSFSVMDYSEPSPSRNNKPYYGDSNIDTEDTEAHGSDIWKKSYGNDMTKVKRRWTMREPTKPGVIREEEDFTTRTLGRKPNYTSTTAINTSSNTNSVDRRKPRTYSADSNRDTNYEPLSNNKRYYDENETFLKVPGNNSGAKYSTMDNRYSPEKNSYKYDEYDDYKTNTLTKRGRNTEKFSRGGGGFGGTPISSGSESNANRMANDSLRSVYLHEPAVITEMPRTTTSSGGGGGASLISGLSGRRTLSKDEISNYSGSRKETKQLSRSMSLAQPWGPNKTYREKYSEIDYSRNNNNLQLPPRPPSRSPSGSLGINAKQPGKSPSKSFSNNTLTRSLRPPPPMAPKVPPQRKPMSSSVESLLRQDTPDEILQKKKGSSKLGRSKSMSVPQSNPSTKDGKGNRFSTLWFNKRNSNK